MEQALNKAPIASVVTKAPHTIEPHQPAVHAMELMRKYRVNHLPVLSQSRLVGIVSERDLLYLKSLKNADSKNAAVSDVMISDPYAVKGSTTIQEVAASMAENHIGSAIVVDDEQRVVGVFTYIDALKLLAS